jgi:flagellar hook-associated protein 1
VSLLGALQLGGSSLAAQQIGLQVTGNNIANAGTPGYSRQVVNLTPGPSIELAPGQSLGTGVNVQSIERQVSESLNESLRNATSDQNAAQTLNSYLTQLQSTYGALSGNDLSSQMSNFFNSFSTLANNPADPGQRSVVIQNGVSLAGNLQSLRAQVSTIGNDVQSQIQAQAVQANSLIQSIASLNQQIATTAGGSGSANGLADQRDQALTQLSQLMNIRTIDTGNGQVNVLAGSTPIVMGTTTRGIKTQNIVNANGTVTTGLVFADNGDTLPVSGGSIGALMNARDNYIAPAVGTIDSLAAGLINTVNTIHSQGQGLAGFASVQGTTQVLDPTAALNASTTVTGIAFPPTNGTFNLNITDAISGQTTSKQISVNLSGQGTQTTLNSLAASITAAGGGNVSATVNSAGNLVMASANQNITFGFGNDTSGALAALGINTFFTGKDASSIGVNNVLTADSDYLATGQDNVAGSNRNAQALALAGGIAVSGLSGKSLQDYYTNYTGNLAAQAKNVSDDVKAQGILHDTLSSQVQSISGVSMDEETINLMNFQQAYQGTARYINVINQMMQTVLTLVQ